MLKINSFFFKKTVSDPPPNPRLRQGLGPLRRSGEFQKKIRINDRYGDYLSSLK